MYVGCHGRSALTSVLIISKDAKRLIEAIYISRYLHSFAHFSLYFHCREQRYHNDDCLAMIDLLTLQPSQEWTP